jgi:hypothetical protein
MLEDAAAAASRGILLELDADGLHTGARPTMPRRMPSSSTWPSLMNMTRCPLTSDPSQSVTAKNQCIPRSAVPATSVEE